MTLRPYQAQAIQQVRGHWSSGARRVAVCLPTGSGKTVIATELLRGARAPLALVHTTELRQQTRRRMPGVRVETIQGAISRAELISADVIFIDECHHIAAGQWRRVLSLLPSDALVVGCTATPERADGTPLGDAFGALVSTADYSTLLAGGWLAPCRVVDTRGLSPAQAYLMRGDGRPGIMFATTIAECDTAVAELTLRGVRAATLHSALSARERTSRIAEYAAGRLDLLASPMALAEGFDAPRAAVCVQARQCVHVGTALQTAGRVLRPHPSKHGGAPALILDCTGAYIRHGSPTDDRIYSLEGTAIARRPPPALPAARRTTPQPAARPPHHTYVRRPPPAAHVVGRAIGRTVGAVWRALWTV